MSRKAWAHLYKTARWQRLRQATFIRDGFTCRDCGIICAGKGRKAHNAPVCDHRTPHKGNEALFYDPANLQTLCATCHNGAKASFEATGIKRQFIGADGWPIEQPDNEDAHDATTR